MYSITPLAVRSWSRLGRKLAIGHLIFQTLAVMTVLFYALNARDLAPFQSEAYGTLIFMLMVLVDYPIGNIIVSVLERMSVLTPGYYLSAFCILIMIFETMQWYALGFSLERIIVIFRSRRKRA